MTAISQPTHSTHPISGQAQQLLLANGAFVVLLAVGGLVWGGTAVAVPILVGGALAAFNLWLIGRLVRSMLVSQRGTSVVGLVLMKMGILGLIAGALFVFPQQVVALVVGMSAPVLVPIVAPAVIRPQPSASHAGQGDHI